MIVDSAWVENYIRTQSPEKVKHMVARALVALYTRQTPDEQETQSTKHLNVQGFAGPDADIGSSMAKYYMRSGNLTNAQIAVWTREGKNGKPKLCKYAKQLNEVAQSKGERHG